MAQYFYDQQIRRWLLQFMRLFAGFNVKMGKNAEGDDIFHEVPIRYGDINRMAAHIITQNSENKMNTVPFISTYISELLPSADRRMNPTHTDSTQVFEKTFDENTGTYLDEVGSNYTLERHAPVPYDLTLTVDVWTSNTEQKLQLLEQILLLFNPSVNLQSSKNPFDWTSLAVVELINITWSARAIPQGSDETIDVASLIFQLPIFLTPPARIKRQVLIHSILANTHADVDPFDDLEEVFKDIGNRHWVTFENRHINVQKEAVQLLNSNNTLSADDGSGGLLSWQTHFDLHGGFRPGISEIRLRLEDDPIIEQTKEVILVLDEIVGTNPNLVKYTVVQSTLPTDTILMVNGVVNPTRSSPGNGNLPAAALGQRYIILDEVPQGAGWGNVANSGRNDIIEFNGTDWIVVFDSSEVNVTGYTTNANTLRKLYYTGTDWVDAIEGNFEEGFWRIVL
jgi:hypothetical protein